MSKKDLFAFQVNIDKIPNKKYFKITNLEENHNGFQYKTGLNILDKEFEELYEKIAWYYDEKYRRPGAVYDVFLRAVR